MSHFLHRFYEGLPAKLQHVAVSIRGGLIEWRRFGSDFEDVLGEGEKRASYSVERLRRWRKSCLKTFMRRSRRSSYWRRVFGNCGVDVERSEPFRELRKLPVLRKSTVKKHTDEISVAGELKDDIIERHTSGTTGSGLQFVETRQAEQEQWAVWWRYRLWHGLTRQTWCGTFGGRQIVNTEQYEPPFWRYNLPGTQIRFSNYHISPANAAAYAKRINASELTWLHGYPSAIALLAQFVLEQDLGPFPDIRIVTTGAENLLSSQRKTIGEAFNCEVRQHYGLAESVANISECPEGRLHVDEDFAGVEFLPTKDADGCRIVGTNWTNPAFPLFRYDTGDIAELSDEEECPCGRPGRLVESINGRQEDYVLIPSGARIGRLDHIFKDLTAVREAQIYQPRQGKVVFRVVRSERYDKRATESELLREARDLLGEEIDIEIKYVDEIPRTDAGKIKFVVSDIDEMKVGGHDS